MSHALFNGIKYHVRDHVVVRVNDMDNCPLPTLGKWTWKH